VDGVEAYRKSELKKINQRSVRVAVEIKLKTVYVKLVREWYPS
jgi:hypothetical protein